MKNLVRFSVPILLLIVVAIESSPLETNQWWVTQSCNGYCYKFDHYGCANCCVGGRILNSPGANKGKYGKCDEYKRCLCDTIGIKRDSKYSSNSNYYDQKQSASNYYGQSNNFGQQHQAFGQGQQSSNFGVGQQQSKFGQQQPSFGQQSSNFGGGQQQSNFGQQSSSSNFGRQPLSAFYDDEA